MATATITAGTDYTLLVALTEETTNNVNVVLNGKSVVSYTYNYFVHDGGLGLMARNGSASFDNLLIRGDDPTVGANHPPVAANDSATTNKATPVIIPVLANDSDPDGNSLTVTGLTAPPNGTAVLNAGGTVTYTPKSGFAGIDTFTYMASDGSANSNVATVTVQVGATTNTPPVAANDSANTNKNSPISIAVLANDTDANGDTLTVANLTQPASGSAVVLNANGTVTYTPKKGFTGTDSFTYKASDGSLLSSATTVTISVK